MLNLNTLNPSQREAACTINGPVLILAGAGSGKTRTVTFRIANMVNNHSIPPEQVLALSFTNKAANEMKERLIKIIGREQAKKMTLSTFHALGVKILREDIDKLGYKTNFSICDQTDQMAIVREGLHQYKGEKNFDRKEILAQIGSLKNKGISSSFFGRSKFFNAEDPYHFATEHTYQFYQDKLKFYNAIDFDDILGLVVELFQKHPEVAAKFSNRFKYIMIDEYQDTNSLQFRIVEGLTSQHNNICVVGDDDQSIYAFRGADITNILSFERQFSGAKVIKLEENYRSSPKILDLANKVISENKNRKEKKMFGNAPIGPDPVIWTTGDTEHEAEIVAEEILNLQNKGTPLSDIAILYRSNTQTPAFEDSLRISQIPYKILGGQKHFEKKEVKDIIAYLTVIHNPSNEAALRRILNVPNRGIGTQTLKKFLDHSEINKTSLYKSFFKSELAGNKAGHIQSFMNIIFSAKENFNKLPLSEAISKLITELDFFSFIDKHYSNPKQVQRRKQDLIQFVESANRFSKYYEGKATLRNFLEKVLLEDNQDTKDEEGQKNQVTLMTLHSSKGLEFETVFLVGVEEELLPHKKSTVDGAAIEEERRLTYVGLTRAKQRLYLTHCKERNIYGTKRPRMVSRFIKDYMDKEIKKVDRTTFGHMGEEGAKEYKRKFFEELMADLD